MDKNFVEGMRYFPPREKAPDFVKGTISVEPAKLMEYLETQETDDKGYVKFQIKLSKNGKYYLEVDTWKPENKSGSSGIEGVPF